MRKYSGLAAAAIAALFATLVLSGCGYNDLQRQDEQVKSAWSEVVNQSQRRADLVPNLVATVPGSAAQWQQGNMIWDGLQQELTKLSTHGHRIIAKGSGHYIQFDRPDLVNREVPVFIQQIREGSVPAADGHPPQIE